MIRRRGEDLSQGAQSESGEGEMERGNCKQKIRMVGRGKGVIETASE
jgi:hypothetical protein